MTPAGELRGMTALITGVSRRRGIGYAVALELAQQGASVFLHHFAPHDAEQPWGGDDVDAVRAGVRGALGPGARFADAELDLAEPQAPAELVAAAGALTGSVDILVCNHARSGMDGSILEMSPERLDGHWAVNARSTILLTAEFARARAASLPSRGAIDADLATARVIWMTSGQQHGPMPGEVAYAASKAALAGVTATVASELLPLGIVLNTVNPGPVNTGYLDPDTSDRPAEVVDQVAAAMPLGRFGQPEDVARLVGWLVGPDGRWTVGQVLTSDGGFSLR